MEVRISNNNPSIHGISIVVLNNETYYYPPNTNINFFKKDDLFDYILVSLVHFILINDFFRNNGNFLLNNILYKLEINN